MKTFETDRKEIREAVEATFDDAVKCASNAGTALTVAWVLGLIDQGAWGTSINSKSTRAYASGVIKAKIKKHWEAIEG